MSDGRIRVIFGTGQVGRALSARLAALGLPVPMETTYTWEDTTTGATRMTLRNRGIPAGFAKIASPMMASAMRRANRNDLSRLKQILERDVSATGSADRR